MKRITALLIAMAVLLGACSTDVTEPEEFPSLEGWQASAMHEPDGVVDEPPRPITTPRRTTTTPPKPSTPEPPPPYISAEEAKQAARNTIDPNDEFNYHFEFHNSWSSEIDGVHYYSGHWRSSPGGEFLGMLYVDRLTSEVFLNVNGKFMTLPLDELTEVLLFVRRFNEMNLFKYIPAFSHINEIPLENIIKMFERNFDREAADFQYTEEQLEKLEHHRPAYGVYPSTIERFIREKYNPDFNIGHYDFNIINNHGRGLWLSFDYIALWDEETGAVAFAYIGSAGGGAGSGSTVLKIEQEGDLFYAVTVDTWGGHTSRGIGLEGYFLQTVRKNENNGLIMLSKQAIDINDGFFTEEEINDIKDSFWIADEIIIDGRFVISAEEVYNIIKSIADNIDSDEELKWWKPELIDGYFTTSIYYGGYNETALLWDGTYIGYVTINALTGEAHFEERED